MSKLRPYYRTRTPEQQAKFREHLEQRLATYRRPQKSDIESWLSAKRAIGHFRREYEFMPLIQFYGGLCRIEDNYHFLKQKTVKSWEKQYSARPLLLAADVVEGGRIWREVRDAWVQQWLREAQQLFGLQQVPASEGAEPGLTEELGNIIYGDVVPGIPRPWLEAPQEWPEHDWERATPGIFEVYLDDLDEVRQHPTGLYNVGSCEPDEFEVMNLPDVAALGRIIVALYDYYGADSLLTRNWDVEKEEWQEGEDGLQFGPAETVFYTRIAFDCRAWLKQEGGGQC